MSFGSTLDLEEQQNAVDNLKDAYEQLNALELDLPDENKIADIAASLNNLNQSVEQFNDLNLDLPRVDEIDDVSSSLNHLNQSIEQYNELDFNLPCPDCVDVIETYAASLNTIVRAIEIINNTDLDAFQSKVNALSNIFKDFDRAAANKAASVEKLANSFIKFSRAINDFQAVKASVNL